MVLMRPLHTFWPQNYLFLFRNFLDLRSKWDAKLFFILFNCLHCYFAILSTLSLCHLVTSSPCHLVSLSPCHLVTLSPCHLVTLSPCHLVILSSCHLVILSFWLAAFFTSGGKEIRYQVCKGNWRRWKSKLTQLTKFPWKINNVNI